MRLLAWGFILSTTWTLITCIGELDTVFKWKFVDFLWNSRSERQKAIDSRAYIPSAPLPIDVDVSQDGRVFVTLANFEGTPARLGVVTNHDDSTGPLIKPFPDWESFKIDDCNSIQNVLRVAIDSCNRLWTVDNGYRPGNYSLCKPKMLAFDLGTNKLLKREIIPDNIAKMSQGKKVSVDEQSAVTFLVNIVVETHGNNCENTTDRRKTQCSEKLTSDEKLATIVKFFPG
ncbi:hypothetical protein QAD02_015735 [Eretmocerus hayati]|uniref:Uncharacterized protein n=1 Tax=Eretmocerus hayati TaxID=131215 RepID=A0ACC2PA48_9HYME|nr:hypothetical protein QAD02_015735 [Eretmocerus hayati]